MLKAQTDLRTRYAHASQFPGHQLLLCILLVPFTMFLSHLPCALLTLPCCFHCNPRQCEFFRQRHPWCFQKERATHKQRFEHTCWKAEAVFPVYLLLTGCRCERPCHSPRAGFVCSAEQEGKHLIMWEYQMFTQWDVSEQLKLCVLVTCPAEHKADREPWSTKNLRGCLWSMQLWLTVSVQPATVLLGYGCSHLS